MSFAASAATKTALYTGLGAGITGGIKGGTGQSFTSHDAASVALQGAKYGVGEAAVRAANKAGRRAVAKAAQEAGEKVSKEAAEQMAKKMLRKLAIKMATRAGAKLATRMAMWTAVGASTLGIGYILMAIDVALMTLDFIDPAGWAGMMELEDLLEKRKGLYDGMVEAYKEAEKEARKEIEADARKNIKDPAELAEAVKAAKAFKIAFPSELTPNYPKLNEATGLFADEAINEKFNKYQIEYLTSKGYDLGLGGTEVTPDDPELQFTSEEQNAIATIEAGLKAEQDEANAAAAATIAQVEKEVPAHLLEEDPEKALAEKQAAGITSAAEAVGGTAASTSRSTSGTTTKKKKKKGNNMLLWGGIGGGVLLLIIIIVMVVMMNK